MRICSSCGWEFDTDAICRAETFDQYVGRDGRHGGRCWGGAFPTEEDMRPLPAVDAGAARARGAFRHHQQRLFAPESVQAA
jgi:hypothetical protein